jgi:hypothetical protein
MGYCIAINELALDDKLPPGDGRWARLNDSFINQEVEPFDFANAIYMGRAYSAWHSGRRKDDNFLRSQFIAVDCDTEDERSSIPYLLGLEFVNVYAALIHSTPSHTDAKPRSRVVFLLDEPIADSAAYEVAIGFVYSLFPGSDTSCIDSSRFFYGSKNCEIELLVNNVLPVTHLRSYYNRWRRVTTPTQQVRRQQPQPYTVQHRQAATEKGTLTPDAFLDYAVKDAPGEGRNNRGYRLGRQLREMGLSLFEAEGYLREYQRKVEHMKDKPYTEAEALANARSAYGRAMGH